MRNPSILISAAGFIHTAYACSAERPSLSRRDVAAGGKCGAAAGNAVCAASLCCSSAGITHCTTTGKVALTFDDGPYVYTAELLDVLKKNNVRATFFVVGNNGGKGQVEQGSSYPAIVQRMYKEGHQIGSHSWSHQDLGAVMAQQRRDQILRNEVAFVDILGFFPTYFRPPYTSCPDGCIKDLSDLGYHIANYDVDTKDYLGDYNYARNTFTSMLSQQSPAAASWIALAHDIQPNTVQTFAQYMIDQARKLGYELVPLGTCLGDPEANWYRNPTSGEPWGAKPAASVAQKSTNSSSLSSVSKGSAVTTTEGATRALPASSSPTPVSGNNFGMGTGNTATISGAQAAATSADAATKSSDGGSCTHVSVSALLGGSIVAALLQLLF